MFKTLFIHNFIGISTEIKLLTHFVGVNPLISCFATFSLSTF